MTEKAPRPTPLRTVHEKAGGRLVDFAGWELPIQFEGIQAEHRLVREHVGLFDVSHMGRVAVRGTDAGRFLNGLLPYDMSRLTPGRMAYTVLCNHDGGAIDDLAVYRLAEHDYLLVVNASRTTLDLAWIKDQASHSGTSDLDVVERTAEEAMIAIQGPEAEGLLAAAVCADARDLGFFRCLTMSGTHGDWLISRSGYTGEDGFEVICPAAAAADLWSSLLAGGARPAGLAARDTLRLEAGLCLYGNELSEGTTPLEAGLGWTLALDKDVDFPGRQVLCRQRQMGVSRCLVGLRLLARGIPRAGQKVQTGERFVGEITSGSHSPTLNRGIGLAYVESDCSDVGQHLQVAGRSGGLEAEIVDLPFVPARVRRRRARRRDGARETTK
ncbi:MAG TPA: glycine cleavage system aminomethyltransferase GcvT [Candidatus Latescibacteria bacterium]|jgi:aminomethyltransferase|nr:glycine cleavage system protein T [Gemmatimonadaceae bacterium]MDP6016955.1 glycine cleavage system aminomethyltransferase GcvT [Candidatus Latescibacterota bacterium]HJP31786.1 glycine cleavage system aminomethyltransferase GcvT [Candidatus Latescibacterota bacterium]